MNKSFAIKRSEEDSEQLDDVEGYAILVGCVNEIERIIGSAFSSGEADRQKPFPELVGRVSN